MILTSLEFAIRENLPLDNINAALLFSKNVKELEEHYISKITNDLSSSHRAYSLSCLDKIVGFLETSINDLYANAIDNFVDQLKGIENHIPSLSTFHEKKFLKKLDKHILENSQSTIIEKYQYALQLLNIRFIDVNDEMLVEIRLVIHIRNYFTHHFARWLRLNADIQTKYELLKGRFEENPLYKDKANPFFPEKLLGYGFLQWAISLSIRFVIKFYNKIGLQYFFMNLLVEKLTENNQLK